MLGLIVQSHQTAAALARIARLLIGSRSAETRKHLRQDGSASVAMLLAVCGVLAVVGAVHLAAWGIGAGLNPVDWACLILSAVQIGLFGYLAVLFVVEA
jgi:hypothetical protein